jgi:anti-sigma B factor antagonist
MTTHSEGGRRRRRPIIPRQAARRTRGHPPVVPLEVRVERYATAAVLHLSGEFDLGAVGRVERALDRALGAPTDRLVFDLRGVSFLDLSGLNTLLRADARARRESFALAVVPPSGRAARILAATHADQKLRLLD